MSVCVVYFFRVFSEWIVTQEFRTLAAIVMLCVGYEWYFEKFFVNFECRLFGRLGVLFIEAEGHLNEMKLEDLYFKLKQINKCNRIP